MLTREAGPIPFTLHAPYKPAGDQPGAIQKLTEGLRAGARRLTLEGVTGSGKTFTVAHVIRAWGRPTLVISHNKTLAAQLYTELKGFFPDHAVEYFVSYYDYYQPEAYIPQTDTYIEKDASINEAIERFRLGATNSLLTRRDVVIVASVSCIYGLGSPEDYRGMLVELETNQAVARDAILERLVDIQYARNDYDPRPGTFRVRGDTLDIFPSYGENGVRVAFWGDVVEALHILNPTTGKAGAALPRAAISPARHFVMPRNKIEAALSRIRAELDDRLQELARADRLLEAQRLRQRTEFDLEMLRELGYCSGIENYSRHLSGRAAGEPPACLLDYFDGEFLTVIDESHVTLPQLRAMYNGDQARKQTLVDHGFRLPSAKDNRPLRFEEFMDRVGALLFTSATPAAYERQESEVFAEQVIRPTGLLDPPVEVRPLARQVDDLLEEVRRAVEAGERALVTTLAKRSAEDLAAYMREAGFRVAYLHSDIGALERVEILGQLREGTFDCLVGVNLLREGLDLPEVAVVLVLDADKEGFLRSDTSLIQTAGRTARHVRGRVILYADQMTDAMRRMIEVTRDRRSRQQAYNAARGITPRSAQRAMATALLRGENARHVEAGLLVGESQAPYDAHQAAGELEAEMLRAADALEFERAAMLRDQLRELRRAFGREPRSDPPAKPPATPQRRRR